MSHNHANTDTSETKTDKYSPLNRKGLFKRYPYLSGLKYLHIERSRHGKVCFYYRQSAHHRRIRLPDISEPEFLSAYANVASRSKDSFAPAGDSKFLRNEKYRGPCAAALEGKIKSAKARAGARGGDFNLSYDGLIAMLEVQDYRCAMTGIRFYTECDHKSHSHPFGLSIDRIDNNRGYTMDNVRLVCFAINAMMMDWGEDIMRKVMAAYKKRRPF